MKAMKLPKPAIYALIVLFTTGSIWFGYHFSVQPLLVNQKLNIIIMLTRQDQCEQSFELLDSLPKKNLIERYLQNQLVDATTKCLSQFDSSSRTARVSEIQKLLQDRLERYPYETKSWIALAAYTNILLANAETDEQRDQLAQISTSALKKALELSPSREEIHDRLTYSFLLAKQYPKAKESAEYCLEKFPQSNRCLAWLELTQLFLGERQTLDISPNAGQDMREHYLRAEFLHLLLPTAIEKKDYDQLIEIYDRLVTLEGPSPEYSQSLALAYAQIEDGYKDAIAHALDFLNQNPQAKEQVRVFLQAVMEKTRKDYPPLEDRIRLLHPEIKERIRSYFPGVFEAYLETK